MKRQKLFTAGALATLLIGIAGLNAQAQERQTPIEKHTKWEATIRAFKTADKTNPPPQNAILFIGSSSVRMWTNLAKDFPNHKVINRGFGGSQIADSTRYAGEIVLPYRPKAIVFYSGDNDISASKLPIEVFSDFKRFVYKVHWAQPKVRIFFVSIKPSPSRWHLRDKVEEANRLIREYCDRTRLVDYIDVYSSMLDAEGKPQGDLFKPDKLHLNEKGYALWTSIIRPNLDGL